MLACCERHRIILSRIAGTLSGGFCRPVNIVINVILKIIPLEQDDCYPATVINIVYGYFHMDKGKINAAKKAVELISEKYSDNIILGIGTGSTINYFLKYLSEFIRDNDKHINCIPTSFETAMTLYKFDIPIVNECYISDIDIAIDGADFIDEKMNLIKGRGGAHLREKIIAYNSREFYVIVDSSKLHRRISEVAVPLEVIPFSVCAVKKKIEEMGFKSVVRTGSGKDGPVISDNGNIIVDMYIDDSQDLEYLEKELNSIPGVVDNGIFSHKYITGVIAGDKAGVKIFP